MAEMFCCRAQWCVHEIQLSLMWIHNGTLNIEDDTQKEKELQQQKVTD